MLSRMGFIAQVTEKRQGDGGIDLIAINSGSGMLVQCKSSQSPSIGWDAIKEVVAWLGTAIKANLPAGMLQSLLADGVVAGLGGVVVFLPQIVILFFFILAMEASGYMARAAFPTSAEQAAIYATASIGRVILASAATVAFAFLSMVFAKLNVFAALGPACALAVFIGFLATVTLLALTLKLPLLVTLSPSL